VSGFRKKSNKFKARSKMCWNKKTLATKEEAEDAAVLAFYLYKSDQEPYLCPNCNLYHLTRKKVS